MVAAAFDVRAQNHCLYSINWPCQLFSGNTWYDARAKCHTRIRLICCCRFNSGKKNRQDARYTIYCCSSALHRLNEIILMQIPGWIALGFIIQGHLKRKQKQTPRISPLWLFYFNFMDSNIPHISRLLTQLKRSFEFKIEFLFTFLPSQSFFVLVFPFARFSIERSNFRAAATCQWWMKDSKINFNMQFYAIRWCGIIIIYHKQQCETAAKKKCPAFI